MTNQNNYAALRPAALLQRAEFSSGPCPKRPNWDIHNLNLDTMGRSHRSSIGKKTLSRAIELSKSTLNVPNDWLVGIVPASDTGAFEMAMWNMLGERGVDALAWESFGKDWVKDIQSELKLEDVRVFTADYGQLPDLTKIDFSRDVTFTWNGTTSGVRVPNGDFIPSDREGLVFCDATSAVYGHDLDWDKLDVVTWSWQKALGSEGAHGMLMLSPRAVNRLENYSTDRPLPKIFRIKKGNKVNASIFEGATINTPSMLAVADFIDALEWVEKIGGCSATQARAKANYDVIDAWVEKSPWIDFLAENANERSYTSVCLKFVAPEFTALDNNAQSAFAKAIVKRLEKEKAAYDIGSYRDAPTGLRIWCGPTVEPRDLECLTQWINWAYNEELSSL